MPLSLTPSLPVPAAAEKTVTPGAVTSGLSSPLSPIPREETASYFRTRPYGSQLGAWASPQSAVVSGRAALDERYTEMSVRFGEQEVPRPEHWGGYCVTPETVELWQGRLGRMHDRLRYRRVPDGPDGWVTERLAP